MLVNDEHARNFWTLPVRKRSTTTPPSWSTLLQLVEQANDVMRKFRQPAFSGSPIFHVSLASCAGNGNGDSKMMPNDDNDEQQQRPTTTASSMQKEDDIRNTVQHDVATVDQIVTTGKKQIEPSSSSDNSDEEDDANDTPRLHRARIHCTFGNTEFYVLPLVKSG